MKLLTLLIIALLLVPVIHAEDYSRYCSMITEIYGVCSPELVANYLAHSQDTPPRHTQAKPQTATGASVFNQITANGKSGGLNAIEIYERTGECWYKTDVGWKQCRLVV